MPAAVTHYLFIYLVFVVIHAVCRLCRKENRLLVIRANWLRCEYRMGMRKKNEFTIQNQIKKYVLLPRSSVRDISMETIFNWFEIL